MIALLSNKNIDILTKDALNRATSLQKNNQPYIVDMVTLEKVFLQGLPMELDIDGGETHNAISSPIRNLPFYNYGGAEDTIRFTISWFAEVEDLDDVLAKCKWLYALSRIDGNTGKVHHVKLFFGQLFKESDFIITSAKYRLRLFHREKSMLPQLAIQDIILKRISSTNPDHATMRKTFY